MNDSFLDLLSLYMARDWYEQTSKPDVEFTEEVIAEEFLDGSLLFKSEECCATFTFPLPYYPNQLVHLPPDPQTYSTDELYSWAETQGSKDDVSLILTPASSPMPGERTTITNRLTSLVRKVRSEVLGGRKFQLGGEVFNAGIIETWATSKENAESMLKIVESFWGISLGPIMRGRSSYNIGGEDGYAIQTSFDREKPHNLVLDGFLVRVYNQDIPNLLMVRKESSAYWLELLYNS